MGEIGPIELAGPLAAAGLADRKQAAQAAIAGPIERID
jgi:hypothetical protein